jgi:uncharacterized protein YkwD
MRARRHMLKNLYSVTDPKGSKSTRYTASRKRCGSSRRCIEEASLPGPDRRVLRLIAAVVAVISVPAPRLHPTPVQAAANCSTARPAGSDGEEQSMLSLINSYRSQNGLSPLAPSPGLMRAALWKSSDMAQNQYFSHDDLGRGWLQRLLDCGYSSTNDGEDIAAGNADAQHTFEQWRTSPPHNANLLSATFHVIGVGRAELAGGQWYWTADFGPSMDADAPAPTTASSSAGQVSHGSIGVGLTAMVNTPNDCLRVHSQPSIASTVSACLPDGATLLIAGGPVTGDGYSWWSTSSGGWVAGQYIKPPP